MKMATIGQPWSQKTAKMPVRAKPVDELHESTSLRDDLEWAGRAHGSCKKQTLGTSPPVILALSEGQHVLHIVRAVYAAAAHPLALFARKLLHGSGRFRLPAASATIWTS